MKLWRWESGRQGSGYRKFTLLFSEAFGVDAYILHIPKGVAIPPHTDKVPFLRHFRLNVTLRGELQMQTPASARAVYRIGNWFSFFRPDIIEHWAPPTTRSTYILSIGWLKF